MYHLCYFCSICIMCCCGCVSDHIGPSALINSIWFDFYSKSVSESRRRMKSKYYVQKIRLWHRQMRFKSWIGPFTYFVTASAPPLDRGMHGRRALGIGVACLPLEPALILNCPHNFSFFSVSFQLCGQFLQRKYDFTIAEFHFELRSLRRAAGDRHLVV